MDDRDSLLRRVWRIVCPLLIYLGIQLAVLIIFGVIGVFSAGSQGGAASDATLIDDLVYGFARVIDFLYRHSLLIMLVSHMACASAFLLIWRKERVHNGAVRNKRPVMAALLSAGLFAGFNFVLSTLFYITGLSDASISPDNIAGLMGRGELIVQVAAIGVVMPIGNELLFRGILISRMRWMPVWAAVLVSGFLFGFAQLSFLPGVYSFIIGLLLGLLYVKFRSVLTVIIAHVSFNLLTILLNVVSYHFDLMDIAVPVISAVMVPLCAYYIVLSPKLVNDSEKAISDNYANRGKS